MDLAGDTVPSLRFHAYPFKRTAHGGSEDWCCETVVWDHLKGRTLMLSVHISRSGAGIICRTMIHNMQYVMFCALHLHVLHWIHATCVVGSENILPESHTQQNPKRLSLKFIWRNQTQIKHEPVKENYVIKSPKRCFGTYLFVSLKTPCIFDFTLWLTSVDSVARTWRRWQYGAQNVLPLLVTRGAQGLTDSPTTACRAICLRNHAWRPLQMAFATTHICHFSMWALDSSLSL